MKTMVVAVSVLLFSAPAMAQDGGKLPWNHDPQKAMAEAKRTGKAMFMFFTSLG